MSLPKNLPFPTKTFSQPEVELRVEFDALNQTTILKAKNFFGCVLNPSTTSSTVPRPALSPPQAPHGTGRGLEHFGPKIAGGRSSRGCRERLSPKPKPTFSPEGFGDRLAAHDASNPPSLRLCPAVTGAPPPPPPLMAPAPVPETRLGKVKPAAPRKAEGPVGAAAHRVAALLAAAAG